MNVFESIRVDEEQSRVVVICLISVGARVKQSELIEGSAAVPRKWAVLSKITPENCESW